MCLWVRAMDTYATVYRSVEPKLLLLLLLLLRVGWQAVQGRNEHVPLGARHGHLRHSVPHRGAKASAAAAAAAARLASSPRRQ
jgi:hypothetical protein